MLIITVLGYGFTHSPKTLLANRRPFIKLLSFPDGNVINPSYPKTSDDTIFLHGNIISNSTTNDTIPLSLTLRGGRPFPGTPGLEWRIYGERGEIRITAPGPYVQIGYEEGMRVQVNEFGSGGVEEVDWERDGDGEGDVVSKMGLPVGARNVGRVYEGLRVGRVVCGFEDAVERHVVLEEMYVENGIVVEG